MIFFNMLFVVVFLYLLMTKDYTEHKWMYYFDGLVFAINFAVVLNHVVEQGFLA
jgi:hypothetical protein